MVSTINFTFWCQNEIREITKFICRMFSPTQPSIFPFFSTSRTRLNFLGLEGGEGAGKKAAGWPPAGGWVGPQPFASAGWKAYIGVALRKFVP